MAVLSSSPVMATAELAPGAKLFNPTRTRCCCQQQPVEDPQCSAGGRREAMVKVASVAVAIGSGKGFSVMDDAALAADLIQRSQRAEFLNNIKGKLAVAIKENREIVPPLLRLALNDSLTYDKATKTGGPNGSIRFSSELSRPENQGLESAVKFLEEQKSLIDSESRGGPLSWADLIQLGGQSAAKRTFVDAAIQKCGGNEEKGNFLYQAYGSNGQWGFFDKQFGRADAVEADPEGRVLLWEQASPADIKSCFSRVGLGPRQVAVLSAFLGPVQEETDMKLAQDPEFAPYVKKYRNSRETVSQTDYEVDLIGAYIKLSVLGQKINYEAYTYPPRKFKLKL